MEVVGLCHTRESTEKHFEGSELLVAEAILGSMHISTLRVEASGPGTE